MRDNEVRTRLKAGGTAIGTMVFEFFVPGLPSLLAHTGADFAIYDMEHGGVSIETLRMLAAASRGPSPLPFARVPATHYHLMAQALDAGMLGLMIPMVEDGDQARTIVSSTRYPPLGRRGAGFGMAHDDYEGGRSSDKIEALNARTFVIAQIESPAGVEHLDAIAGYRRHRLFVGWPQRPVDSDGDSRPVRVGRVPGCDQACRGRVRPGRKGGGRDGGRPGRGRGLDVQGVSRHRIRRRLRLFADALAAGVEGARKLARGGGTR